VALPPRKLAAWQYGVTDGRKLIVQKVELRIVADVHTNVNENLSLDPKLLGEESHGHYTISVSFLTG
jgi:hypothetical protein